MCCLCTYVDWAASLHICGIPTNPCRIANGGQKLPGVVAHTGSRTSSIVNRKPNKRFSVVFSVVVLVVFSVGFCRPKSTIFWVGFSVAKTQPKPGTHSFCSRKTDRIIFAFGAQLCIPVVRVITQKGKNLESACARIPLTYRVYDYQLYRTPPRGHWQWPSTLEASSTSSLTVRPCEKQGKHRKIIAVATTIVSAATHVHSFFSARSAFSWTPSRPR